MKYAENDYPWIAYYRPGIGNLKGKRLLIAVLDSDTAFGLRSQFEEQLKVEYPSWTSEEFMSIYEIDIVLDVK